MLHRRFTVLFGLTLACGSANSEGLFSNSSLTSNSGAGGSPNAGQAGAGGSSVTAGAAGSVSGGTGGSNRGGAAGSESAGSGGVTSAGAAGEAGHVSDMEDAGAPATDAAPDGPDADTPDTASSLDADVPEPVSDAAVACSPTSDPTEVCDGVDNDCDGQTDPAATCASSCRGFEAAGSRYMFCANTATMALAQSQCEANHQRLAWFETVEENTQVTAAVAALDGLVGLPTSDAQRPTWLGASDADTSEGTWSWVASPGYDTGAFTFWIGTDSGAAPGAEHTNWASGQPDNQSNSDCAVLLAVTGADGNAGQWLDASCTSELSFLCEAPNGD